MGKYAILTLRQGDNLEKFNGKIIKVLSEKKQLEEGDMNV